MHYHYYTQLILTLLFDDNLSYSFPIINKVCKHILKLGISSSRYKIPSHPCPQNISGCSCKYVLLPVQTLLYTWFSPFEYNTNLHGQMQNVAWEGKPGRRAYWLQQECILPAKIKYSNCGLLRSFQLTKVNINF